MTETIFLKLKFICRTCFSDKCLESIASITFPEGISLADILTDFIPKEDLYNDQLPQNICSLCIEQMKLYYRFKKTCWKNESLLKKHLEQKLTATKNIKQNKSIDDSTCPFSDNENASSDSCNSTDSDDKPLIKRLERPILKKKTNQKKKFAKQLSPIAKPFNKNEKRKLRKNNSENFQDLSNEKKYSCKQCYKSFTFKYKLVMHTRVHTQEKPFKCDICPLSFSLNGNLKRHKMIHTGEKPHVCKICGKGFIQATSLQMHSEKHHKENIRQNFTCKICSRVFVRAAPYNSHLKKHHPTELAEQLTDESKEKIRHEDFKYKCDICGKTFEKLVFLKRHTSRHGEKKFLCSDCGKGFVRKADLQSHIKVHTGEKPHTCPICNKSFAHTGSLVTHSLVHSGYKPYNCTLCSKTFTQLSHLKVHKRTHSGERPYSCSFCDKTFALKSNLTVHVRIHTGETPYLCIVCGKGFYDSSSMKKHKLSHYSILKIALKTETDCQSENFVYID